MKRPSPLIGSGALPSPPRWSPRVPPAPAPPDVIKFGVSTPLSGPAAPWGIPPQERDRADLSKRSTARVGSRWAARNTCWRSLAYDHKYVIAEGVATVNRLIAKDGVK